jgi:hypothetical protein
MSVADSKVKVLADPFGDDEEGTKSGKKRSHTLKSKMEILSEGGIEWSFTK